MGGEADLSERRARDRIPEDRVARVIEREDGAPSGV
jgi:hypothetical protein